MKHLKLALAGVCLVTASSLFANDHSSHDHASMNQSSTSSSKMAYHNEMMTRDDFKVEIMISNGKEALKNADVKVKFFMPEMPGMPYMEYEDEGKLTNGVFKSNIHLSMNGTWQYQIRFRTDDKKVRSVKGSVNY
jgi:hypothetical protein